MALGDYMNVQFPELSDQGKKLLEFLKTIDPGAMVFESIEYIDGGRQVIKIESICNLMIDQPKKRRNETEKTAKG